jgi:2,3-bisphosphoglycerate-independent phosphoglycerate mutase
MDKRAYTPPRVLLMILDGWGIATQPEFSAIDQAKTPFYDRCLSVYPHAELGASERAVGLPKGQMGNSEVGHTNLGAGRVVYQELERIGNAFAEHTVADMPAMRALLEYCKKGHKLHLLGLVSDGGVHSHIDHVKSLVSLVAAEGLEQVYIHAFTDGRDTDPLSGLVYLQALERHLQAVHCGRIASVIGRYYAMDRDKRWNRVRKAYDLLVHGKGQAYTSATEALEAAYGQGITDEFMPPAVIHHNGKPLPRIEPGDAVIYFNFRTDRGRQLTQALTQTEFPADGMVPLPLHFVTLTSYDDSYTGVHVLFEQDNLRNTLGEVLAKHNKTQLRVAETEKYPHVTFFFSGGRETPFPGEERILCQSPKVATYDLAPEMAAYDLRDALVKRLGERSFDFICLNFANPDMVGHTGVMEAAIRACEVVDSCAETVTETAHKLGYHVLILADHGNADRLRNPDGTPHTAHTLAKVPFIFVPGDGESYAATDGKLGDIAPTILALLGLPIPPEMNGNCLVQEAVLA